MKKNRGEKATLGEKSVFMTIAKFLGGNLIEQIPFEFERLGKKALYLETEQAKPAAKELLKRAIEVLQHLAPVLMFRPNLLADEAQRRFDLPVLLALSRSHRYYYKQVLDRLRGLKLGSKTGIAWNERANWKSEGQTGAWAVALVNIADALRNTRETGARFSWLQPDPPALTPDLGDHVIEAFVLAIRTPDPEDWPGATADEKAKARELNQTKTKIANDAKRLKPFGPSTVEDWINKVCRPVLYILRPELRPAKRGKRKQTDKERADPRAKKQRDAIVARIRAVVENPGALVKAHSWAFSSRKSSG